MPDAVYEESDFGLIGNKWKKSLIYAGCYLAFTVAVLAYTMLIRNKVMTIATGALLGCIAILLWGMKISPIRLMRRYLYEIHSGLTKHTSGRVVFFSEDITPREGIECFQVILNVGEKDDPKDERLFYWNASMKRPQCEKGGVVSITSHGNDIIGFAVVL